MRIEDRDFRWDDEARVIATPQPPATPHYHADLASCVARALEMARSNSRPASIEIEHTSGMIGIDEIERLGADPSFPADPSAIRIQPDAEKP